MEEAADDGRLLDALGQAKGAAANSQVDGIRTQMRNLLSNACDSGDLHAALSKALSGSQVRDERSQQTDRRLARDGNSYSYAEFIEFFGEDWGAVYWQNAPPDPSKTVPSSEVEAVRQKMRNLMEAACDSGALEEAFVRISPK